METPAGQQRTITITLPPIEESRQATPGNTTPAVARVASLTTIIPPMTTDSPKPPVAPPVPGQLEVKCVRLSNLLNREESAADQRQRQEPAQCIYMSADMQKVFEQPIRNKQERNRVVFLLMNISDANCTTYLHRFYATRAGWDAAHGTGKDVATAIASGTAKVAGGLSSVVGLVNLAGGTAIDNIDKSYYSEKTIQAITAAIKSLRASSKKLLLDSSGKELSEYSYFQAINDLEDFDHSCSLQRGIEQIAELANNASLDAEKHLDELRNVNVTELKKDLEAARRERDVAIQVRGDVQEQLSKTKDDDERKALLDQIRTLTDQVQKSSDEVSKLRSALPSGTTTVPTESSNPKSAPSTSGQPQTDSTTPKPKE
jgi:hypothetical protein